MDLVQDGEHIDTSSRSIRPLAYALIAGALMGSAFLNPFFWWGGIVGLAIYFWGLSVVPHRRHAFWYGAVAGTLKSLMVCIWVWYVYPLTWMGDFSAVSQLFGIGWMWITWAIPVGTSFGILAYVLYPYLEHRARHFIIPLAYVLAEVVGSIFFSITQYGPGGSVNTHTSFGYLGYTLARHGIFGDFAVVAGVYGLSFTASFIALHLAQAFMRLRSKAFAVDLYMWKVLLVTTLFVGSYFVSLPGAAEPITVRVATVNTQFKNDFNLSATEQGERVRLIIDAFRVALQSKSDIIMFPETSYALSVFGSEENVFSFIRSVTDRDVIVMDSDKRANPDGGAAVRAVLYDTKEGETYSMYKKFLVPSGEYLPYQLSFVMSLLGFTQTTEVLDARLAFVPETEDTYSSKTPLPGVLFCSEGVSPTEALVVSNEATLPLILHPVSHAWLNNPTIFWYQLDLTTRTQVRFAGVPLVQAANMWESKAYDRLGSPVTGEEIYKTASTSVVVYEM